MIYKKYIFYLLILAFLYIFSCTEEEKFAPKKEVILARMGNEVITVNDFRNNYEMGFGHLKTGENRKKTYLNFMINEKLLAMEGQKLGFDKKKRIIESSKALEKELLIEALIETKVKNKINITENEIKEAINKSKVSFKFRYWFEISLERAKIVAEEMKARGYADVVDEILLNNPESFVDPKYLETDYLNYLQVSPEVLNAIKDLPYGEISNPVEINGKYYIFQVMDIRRNSVTESEYMSKAPTYKQIIFYRKLENMLVEYGTKLLDSKSIVTKRNAFNLLADALFEWSHINLKKRPDFFEWIYRGNANNPAANDLYENLNIPFMIYKDGEISIEKFIRQFDTNKFRRVFENKKDLIEYLHSNVAQIIRDYFLVKEAEKNELNNHPKVKKELALWRDKWIYSEMRKDLFKNIAISDDEVRDFYSRKINKYRNKKSEIPDLSAIYIQVKKDAILEKIYQVLNDKIESLRNKYRIEINETILDTIRVTDFEKSRWASMQIMKSGTNRPAYPVVDPVWSIVKD